MLHRVRLQRLIPDTALALLLSAGLALSPSIGAAQTSGNVTAFMQAIAETAYDDREMAAFYRDNGYEGIWTGTDEASVNRRNALMAAIARAPQHALPAAHYDLTQLTDMLGNIETQRDLGRAEVELSRLFLTYARDVQTGILAPGEVVSDIKREVPLRDGGELLARMASEDPTFVLRSLPPKSQEYARLMRAKIELEQKMARGGWGPKVPASTLQPGQSGEAVIALRNRLIAMGYMDRSASSVYDSALQKAVQSFQIAMALEPDGVAGGRTMQEINTDIEQRLPSIVVAMERERWLNFEEGRGARHIWVNLTDFKARIIDNDKITFETRSVIGSNVSDQRTPEFSDTMEYMEINPYWNVPNSIAVNEYLPAMLASGGGAAGHLQLVDGRGNVVPRGAINWGAYSPRSFPLNLRQPPGNGNALGLVKFMFPNRYNIYLHDTPAKSLFSREVRTFSHGCIRLNDPFDFAYAILAKQEADPEGYFQRILRSGANTQVQLEQEIPVHLVYRTAYTSATGQLTFRDDVYGRDRVIFDALVREGVRIGEPNS
ncbi:L,D-transpeptidase family protein [Anianabacter salinae]|uniref:L,D-transpeptidase family protein n=1 Tax=Anianabacter salinae TaxID=2851023 RepID=UPI00225E66BC|nr:L,D-transpeptidase family protein [Anianabacter salinae]MBV0912214.1 L,D-transpeptidase family protein [Anianabacter salinae]